MTAQGKNRIPDTKIKYNNIFQKQMEIIQREIPEIAQSSRF